VAKFVLIYTGGRMQTTPEEQQQAMEAWMGWFAGLGADVVDMGNPFGAASTVRPDGSAAEGGASSLGGYSVIEAASLADAASKAKGCPVLAGGGNVEVYEALSVP
jgi:hypothetical protein